LRTPFEKDKGFVMFDNMGCWIRVGFSDSGCCSFVRFVVKDVVVFVEFEVVFMFVFVVVVVVVITSIMMITNLVASNSYKK